MIHRLFDVPLFDQNFKKEKEKILSIAIENNFPRSLIHDLINKMGYKKRLSEVTTFNMSKEEEKTWAAVNFQPKLFPKFKRIFGKYNLKPAPYNNFTLKSYFHSQLKDKTPDEKSSGIYGVNCQDCDSVYVGQTRRNVATRMKEHMRAVKNKEVCKSAVARHCWTENHQIDQTPQLLKKVPKNSNLNIWENIFIFKNRGKILNDNMKRPLSST